MKNFKNFLPQVFERCLAIMAFYFPFIEVSAYFGPKVGPKLGHWPLTASKKRLEKAQSACFRHILYLFIEMSIS